VHDSWLSHPQLRTFDLFLINYSNQPGFGRADATWYVERKGFKWDQLHYAWQEHGDTLRRYDNIWCPDSDIRADSASINRLFELFDEHKLQLAQPAIAKGEVSYEALRQRPGLILRYTPFVELMCPLFTREAFWQVTPLFPESRSGWGLDWIWPRFFEPHQMAIIDQIGVEHTGKLFRGEHYQGLAKLGIYPSEDFDRLMAKYGGFRRRLHRRLVRGKVRLPALREPNASRTYMARLIESIGLRRAVA